MSETTDIASSSYRIKTGKKLIRFAWLVEIIAATVGFLIAALVAVSTYQDIARESTGIPSHIYLSMLLGALPFIMVAVVEICKIPLATAFFHATQKSWKLLFLIGLILLMAITFETVMNGFERNFTQRTYVINKVKKDLNTVYESIERLSSEAATLSLLTEGKILEAYNAARKNIEEERDTKISEIDKAISAQQESKASDQVKVLQEEIKSIDTKIESLESRKLSEIDNLRKEHTSSSQNKASQASTRLSRIESQIADYEDKMLELNEQEEKESGNAFIALFDKSTKRKFETQREELRKKIDALVAERGQLTSQLTASGSLSALNNEISAVTKRYEGRISSLTSKRDRLQTQLRNSVSKNDKTLKPIIDGLNQQRREALKSAEERLKQEQQRYEEQKKSLTAREKKITTAQTQQTELETKRVALRERINELAQGSQIYRVAALWSGKDSPADVTNDELRFVTVIWFGSLAAITAWTGTLLAFAGLAMQFGPRPRSSSRRNKLLHSIRSLVVDLRKRSRAPRPEKIVEKEIEVIVEKPVIQEVVKEIPVDKVVFKEVPKEVITKEYVYVPVLTDDPHAVKEALNKLEAPVKWPSFRNISSQKAPDNGNGDKHATDPIIVSSQEAKVDA